MADDEPTDRTGPWTIKSVANSTREAVTMAARREGLTVGQWLERRVNEWEGAGSPVHVAMGDPVSDLAALLQAAGPWSEANPLPRDVRALLNDKARSARGLLGQQPKPTKAEQEPNPILPAPPLRIEAEGE